MYADVADVLVLAVRAALFAGLCWGAWLCLSERIAAAPVRLPPLQRFATFAVIVLVLTALGGLVPA